MLEALPIRPAFWNIPIWCQIGVYLLAIVVVAIFVYGVILTVRRRKAQLSAQETPESANRLTSCLRDVFLQQRVMRGASGKAHGGIFFGFLLLFWGTATATLDWDVGHYVFDTQFLKGPFYLFYKLTLDIAGAAALTGLMYGFIRRFVLHDPKVDPSPTAVCVLSSLSLIILTGFLVEALRLAATQPAWAPYSPVGYMLSRLFSGQDASTLELAHITLWTLHGLASLAFIAAMPFTYYAHVFKTPLSIYWRRFTPTGAIEKIENIEEQESFGISQFEQFSWRDHLQLDGCTECGRCRSVCPAVLAKSPLDPKNLVAQLRNRLNTPESQQSLIGDIISTESIWSCTTCGACANVCPANIPIPRLVVGMRRHLAMEQGEFPEGLATALENTGSVGNPWGMDPGSRLDWARDLNVPVAKENQPVDVLYWVGCSASYDRRAQKIARAMIEILNAAGVNFAVMREESCHAEFARRAGEEYLFRTAVTANIENLCRYQFREIVAACPHCFNTLKNEYPQFENGQFTVTSHADFIDRLIKEKRLNFKPCEPQSVTLHDACYLARQNGVTQSPRQILAAAGLNIIEPPQALDNTTCCGAGGAQLFMDRPARINVIRLKQLKSTDAQNIAVTCPHCLTMLTSAQNTDADHPQPIADIAELIAARLK